MRTTIHLPDDLFRQLKQLAAETHRTFTTIIEDAAREVLARRKRKASRKIVRLSTFSGTGVQPGVDLNHTASLLDRMDGRDSA